MTEEREQRLAEALARFVELEARDDNADPVRFVREYPDLAPDLLEQIHAWRGLDSDALPATLSGYPIVRELGAGGMGRVFLADDTGLGRRVAIKTLQPRFAGDAGLSRRFMTEARAMARLSHPHIVRIYSLGAAPEPPHFVMEFVDGRPLSEASRPLSIPERMRVFLKVLRAVEFLHANHFVHRDLKPANILVDAQMEPRLLDFGLVRETEARSESPTLAGEVLGTPNYFSPEQAAARGELGPASDIFSLGVILYELLTGKLPFQGSTLEAQMREVRTADPLLPRRHDRAIPAGLQNVCMKALEKDPADRYASAAAMAADLERWLNGESVLAQPPAYGRVMRARVEEHLRDLEGWMHDRLITDLEYDAFRRRYDKLVEREDAWILEARRLTLTQVTLYLGAWLASVAATLLVLFRYPGLRGPAAIGVAAASAAFTCWLGVRLWNEGRYRISIAFLLAFCLLLPVTLLVAMAEWNVANVYTWGRHDLEIFSKLPDFRHITNAQLWFALALAVPAVFGLRRFTRAPVFSLVLSVLSAALCLVTLLRMGLLEWLDKDPGRFYFWLIPCALLFFAAGWGLERARQAGDALYFYPLAVLFTWAALSGLAAFHEPYAANLKSALPWTHGQVEYLFILNAGIYLLLQWTCERIPGSTQMRSVAKAFRFVLPGHVLFSLFLLELSAADGKRTSESHALQVLLPLAAAAFVFGSIPKQMKNFFATGLLFLAVGIVRLQQDYLKERAWWPVALVAAGLLLMFLAAQGEILRRRWRFLKWREKSK